MCGTAAHSDIATLTRCSHLPTRQWECTVGNDGEIVATGLRFPEGPVWSNGRVYITEVEGGTIACWTGGTTAEHFATTGGGPNGATRRSDGSLYVTQNGGPGPHRA